MKVLNIIEEGRFGGPQKRIGEVAEKLKGYDIETVVILPQKDSERFIQTLVNKQVDYYSISLHRLTKNFKHLLGYFFFFIPEVFNIYKIIKKEKPDIIHCNGSFQLKGTIAAKFAGVPNYWLMNDTYVPSYMKILFNVVSTFFGDRFIAASSKSAEYYFPAKVKDIPIVSAPINTKIFNPQIVTPHPDLSKFDGIKVITVGNINPVKGYKTLLNAIRFFNEMYNVDIQFFAIGKLLRNQKKYIDDLNEIIDKNQISNFHFYGPSMEVKELLKAADIYVCCSDFESSPISLWEAMAMGMPIVSTSVGDVEKIFKDEQCGIVVPSQNPELLAKALYQMIEMEPQKRNLFATKARTVAVKSFDLESVVLRHKEIYEKIYLY